MKDKLSTVASLPHQQLVISDSQLNVTLVDLSFKVQHRQSPRFLIHTGL
jgi:hypothetical protein